MDVTITSRNFELIDNELGDVGVETSLKITGELRRPKIVGDVKLQSARLEVDKILALFYDPYSVSAMPDVVVGRRRRREGTGGAEDATRQALASAGSGARAADRRSGEPQAPPPAPAGAFAPVELKVQAADSGEPRAARQEPAAGRTDGRRARRHEHHRRRRRRHHQGARRAGHPAGFGRHRSRHLPVPGPPLRSRARRHGPVHGGTGNQSAARHHGDARDPEHRRRGARAYHRHASRSPELAAHEHAAARRVGHPGADRVQPAGQRAGLRRARVARGDRRRDRRRASSPRRWASRSAARWTSTLRDHDEHRGRGARGRA